MEMTQFNLIITILSSRLVRGVWLTARWPPRWSRWWGELVAPGPKLDAESRLHVCRGSTRSLRPCPWSPDRIPGRSEVQASAGSTPIAARVRDEEKTWRVRAAQTGGTRTACPGGTWYPSSAVFPQAYQLRPWSPTRSPSRPASSQFSAESAQWLLHGSRVQLQGWVQQGVLVPVPPQLVFSLPQPQTSEQPLISVAPFR